MPQPGLAGKVIIPYRDKEAPHVSVRHRGQDLRLLWPEMLRILQHTLALLSVVHAFLSRGVGFEHALAHQKFDVFGRALAGFMAGQTERRGALLLERLYPLDDWGAILVGPHVVPVRHAVEFYQNSFLV
jgi:hypothetical protein